MKIIEILKGTHAHRPHPKGVDIYDHTSSVTLIRAGDSKNILVDTGSRGHFLKIRKALKKEGLSPKDIDIVILTHFHLDHGFNIAHFQNARVIGWSHEWGRGAAFRFHYIHMERVAGGVSIIKTPGHTPEHLSVVVRHSDGRVTVIAGDAINQSYADSKIITANCSDEKQYRQSANKILALADEIIPGHGGKITVTRKK